MKKTIKLRDLTKEQFVAWCRENCPHQSYMNTRMDCNEKCPFTHVLCNERDENCWIYNKEDFSDKFLDQTVEIEVPDLLTEEEKTLLKKVLIVIGKEYVDTFWVDWVNGIKCITWGYFGHRGSKGEAGIILSRFPVKDSDFSNLEKGVYYNKEELGLEGQ